VSPVGTKVVYWVTKRPELTDEQFVAYWTTTHAKLARAIPRVRAYSINLPSPLQRSRRPIDGYAMLRFDSYEDAGAAWATEEGRATAADGEHFMAAARHQIVEPTTIFSVGTDGGVKICYLLDKRADLDTAAFATALVEHATLMERLPGIHKYCVNLPSAAQRSAPMLDGYAVARFGTYEEAAQAWRSPAGGEASTASRSFLQDVRHFIAEERRIVG
jgi:uncharacterized protein (TIGR02118 family)